MRVIHARPSPLPVLFLFCKYVASFFILACLCPFFFFLDFFKNEKFQQANSTVTHVCYKSIHPFRSPSKPTCCIPLHHFRKIRVNCLKEKLKTLGHMIVFLKHDQLIQTEGLIETFTLALNFDPSLPRTSNCGLRLPVCGSTFKHDSI